MLYAEYCPQVYDRKGLMLPVDELNGRHGFRSIYSFSEEAANEIKAQGSSRGLGRFPVYADAIFFDFDDGESGVKELITWLTDRELGYKVWESGAKGFHVSTPHNALFDINLPYTHRKFAESIGIKSDPTLYQSGRIFRLPGTIHQKTGRPKKLIEWEEGKAVLELTVRTPEPTRFNISEVDDEDLAPFFFDSLSTRHGKSPGAGMRHTTVWGLSKDASRCGLSFEATLELMLLLNASWKEDAKDETYIKNAVEQGYEG